MIIWQVATQLLCWRLGWGNRTPDMLSQQSQVQICTYFCKYAPPPPPPGESWTHSPALQKHYVAPLPISFTLWPGISVQQPFIDVGAAWRIDALCAWPCVWCGRFIAPTHRLFSDLPLISAEFSNVCSIISRMTIYWASIEIRHVRPISIKQALPTSWHSCDLGNLLSVPAFVSNLPFFIGIFTVWEQSFTGGLANFSMRCEMSSW